MARKKLGADEVVPEVVAEVVPEIMEPVLTPADPSVSVSEVKADIQPDLMETVVGDKLLYGNEASSCERVGKYYKFTDEVGTTFVKAECELNDILK